MTHSDEIQATLAHLLADHGLTVESRLYRSALPEYLSPTDDPDVRSLAANPDPSEAVIDEYEGGYMTTAAQVGSGLAFAAAPDHQWHAEGRVPVVVMLQDVLDQGGLVYPVASVTTETVWYCTLPTGSIRATIVT